MARSMIGSTRDAVACSERSMLLPRLFNNLTISCSLASESQEENGKVVAILSNSYATSTPSNTRVAALEKFQLGTLREAGWERGVLT